MAATFDPALGRAVDRARLALGDTGPGWMLQDETYAAKLYVHPIAEPPVEGPMTAAYVSLARALASRCATQALQFQQGSVKRVWSDRAAYYAGLADLWAEDGHPDDPTFDGAAGLPRVGQLLGPDTTLLNQATGLAPVWPLGRRPLLT